MSGAFLVAEPRAGGGGGRHDGMKSDETKRLSLFEDEHRRLK